MTPPRPVEPSAAGLALLELEQDWLSCLEADPALAGWLPELRATGGTGAVHGLRLTGGVDAPLLTGDRVLALGTAGLVWLSRAPAACSPIDCATPDPCELTSKHLLGAIQALRWYAAHVAAVRDDAIRVAAALSDLRGRHSLTS